ncbi:MAG: isoleucine--tRNA ligase, partial [Candidatus Altarchaeaceae archaeon]
MQRKSLKEIESEIENFWNENKIYEKFKKLNEESDKKFYFCQGPPFTSGEAHLGHAWNHIIKDSVIRYKSMQGYYVLKRAGWDMHGLPIEVKVEQKFGLKVKKDIEKFGVDKFIEECKNFAIKNANAMTEQLKKLSVYLDWEDAYLTIDKNYMESVWMGIKKAHNKNLLYKKEKVIHWCPRCGTAMAGYEVAEGYKEITDIAIYVKAKLLESFKVNGKIYDNVSILIWTTTPWTLPANVAIAVNPDIDYVLVEYIENGNKEKIICSLSSLNRVFGKEKGKKKEIKKKHYKDEVLNIESEIKENAEELLEEVEEKKEYKILEKFKGEILKDIKYESILDIPLQREISQYHKIVLAKELVSEEEGSGAVHIAPGHGEEDAKIGEKYSLPDPSPVDEEGKFTIDPFKNIYVFDANEIIIENLKENNKLLKQEKIKHTYPHCWRCKTKLILLKTSQWFIAVSKIKERLLELNDKISWIPEFIGHGIDAKGNKTRNSRFENWLKEAKDWCISRQRYWNTPLPIWQCENGHICVIGSIKELEEKSGMKIDDLHKNIVDKIKFKCEKCGKIMQRVPDVMDVWLDSGSASYANLYSSKYKENFSDFYPPDFITEGSDQTRGWFYSLLVMSAIMFDDIPYKTVLYHGFTLDEKGEKMSKSKGNVIDPMDIISKYSVDAFRMYLLSVVPWEDLKFSKRELESFEKYLNILLNTFYFLKTYTEIDNYNYNHMDENEILKFFNSTSIENKIMISLTNLLTKNVKENFEKYYIHKCVSEIINFINDLSKYYVKLIRDKVWIEKESKEKDDVYFTLSYALENLALVSSTIIPHIAEYIYRNFNNKSVCLEKFPEYNENLIDKDLLKKF